jgi:hypothetical protein
MGKRSMAEALNGLVVFDVEKFKVTCAMPKLQNVMDGAAVVHEADRAFKFAINYLAEAGMISR